MSRFHKLNQYVYLILLISTFPLMNSCQKFLDQKPKISQIVPQTLNDLQRLLDNSTVMNQNSAAGFAEFVADNYYVNAATWQNYVTAVPSWSQNYVWGSGAGSLDVYWQGPYTGPIYYSNIVLDRLPHISYEPKDSNSIKAVKGAALFYRAFHFYNLAQVFCRPYDQQYLSYPGIVLRLNSDASIIDHQRATVGEIYNKIILDLKEAAGLLPPTSAVPTRPCQAAAYAALARVYLSMRHYPNAALFSDLALQQRPTLLDYNNIPVNLPPFDNFNQEVIFHDIGANPPDLLYPGSAWIDTAVLYKSYAANDLRKDRFFYPIGTEYAFIGSYYGTNYFTVFDGLTTGELYLIRSECSARAGNKDSALVDLNRLYIKRWKNTAPYQTIMAADGTDVLARIILERRKELVFRGQWWTDIRRLNLEGANITLKRNIGGTIYSLPPNDLRTVMLIPDNEIARSGIQQNPR